MMMKISAGGFKRGEREDSMPGDEGADFLPASHRGAGNGGPGSVKGNRA